MTTLHWFRLDLRCGDNPALAAAAARGPVLPVYVLDDVTPPPGRVLGGASRWWLHHSLAALGKELGGLLVAAGDPRVVLPELAERHGVTAVTWNRTYEPWAIGRDTRLKAELKAKGVAVDTFNGSLLHEPWEVATGAGGPFKVYSPFWRACQARAIEARPLPAVKPKLAPGATAATKVGGDPLDALGLRPARSNWAAGWEDIWRPGAEGASALLDRFLADGLKGYGTLRNRPDLPNVSRLSAHLHFGEISPRQIVARTEAATAADGRLRKDADKFVSELGWREFAHHLLYHFPTLPEANWKPAFDAYPWRDAPDDLAAWRRGRTGYPVVDAGMRELWRTGWMHNRVRMIVASFLIKHLRIDWRHGERWFWDTLVDADLANNAASWQWVAGSGADAAPYFRIFNPISQGEKFDPDGAYVRRWCPELAQLPTEHLFAPFAAPKAVLAAAGVRLGETYPRPIVGHAEARAAALAGYEAVRAAGQAPAGERSPAD